MTATDLSVRANTSATPTVVAVQNGRHGSLKHNPWLPLILVTSGP